MTEVVNAKMKNALVSLSPKAYLNTFIFDDIKNMKKGKKKVVEKDFIIPEYHEYENVILKNSKIEFGELGVGRLHSSTLSTACNALDPNRLVSPWLVLNISSSCCEKG